jgi:hypothetical protein
MCGAVAAQRLDALRAVQDAWAAIISAQARVSVHGHTINALIPDAMRGSQASALGGAC